MIMQSSGIIFYKRYVEFRRKIDISLSSFQMIILIELNEKQFKKGIREMKRTIIKTICMFFTIVFCFVNAPVFNAIAEAENRYAANYGFPLVLTGNKNESGAVDINISLILEIDNVESCVVNIRHWLSCGCIFYEHLKGEERTIFYDAEIGRKYKLSIELTSGENKRYVAGYFVANDSDGAISFDVDYDNYWDEQEFNAYLQTYIPISNDEYDALFKKVDANGKIRCINHLILLKTLDSNYKKLLHVTKNHNKLYNLYNSVDADTVIKAIDQYKLATDLQKAYNKLLAAVKGNNAAIKEVQAEFSTTLKKYTTALEEVKVCPVCKSAITGEVISHITESLEG